VRKDVQKRGWMMDLPGSNRLERILVRMSFLGMGLILLCQLLLAIPTTRSLILVNSGHAVESFSSAPAKTHSGELTIRALSTDMPRNAWVFVDGKVAAQWTDQTVTVRVNDQSQLSMRVNGQGIYRFVIETDDPAIAFPPSGYEIEIPGEQMAEPLPVLFVPHS
jgi:hypothetical protein